MTTDRILKITRLGSAALAVLLFGSALGQATDTTYAVTVVGYADTNQLPSIGIDAFGRVAGQLTHFEEGIATMRAWTYDPANGYLLSPSLTSTINGVSPDGMLVGSSYGAPTVFDWLGNPSVVFPTTTGCFMAVNSSHDAAGYVLDPKHEWMQTAMVYDRNGNWISLEAPELIGSAAYGINDFGAVVGYAATIRGECRAFYWSGGMEFLPGNPENSEVATGINNAATIVGYSVTPTDRIIPVRWYLGPAFVKQVPINLPLGFTDGFAGAISDNGTVVGTMWGNDSVSSRAFIANPEGQVVDLNDLKAPNARVYTLVTANAINANGQIAGTAVVRIQKFGGYSRTVAYIATPIAAGPRR